MTTISESVTKTLGTGSGIDTKALVASLVEAQFAGKNAQLTKQSDALTAQISSTSKLMAGIKGFDTALKSLVSGGTLTTQPSSSNSAAVTVSAIAGAKVAGLSTQLTVSQLAAAQAATTNTPMPATQPFRGGTLTVKIGSYVTDSSNVTTLSADKTVTITVAQGATLEQIAAQLKTEAGLSTALITDGTGVRLSMKGATGAAQAFEIVGADTDSTTAGMGLSALSVGGGATGTMVGATAKDALLTLDGADFKRSTNSIADLVPGVKLELLTTSPSPITLATKAPGSALTQAVEDVVATFNELTSLIKEETNAATGVLKTDAAAATLTRALSQLTTTKLVTSTTGAPQTLSDLGIATQKDGSLKLDSAKLTALMAKDPAGVEAIFAVDAAGKGGLTEALSKIATAATDKTYGLQASSTRYTKAQTTIAEQQAKTAEAATAASTRMTSTFAKMDARVAAYKATQTFMENQIKIWTKAD